MKSFELVIKFTLTDKGDEQIDHNPDYSFACDSDEERVMRLAKVLQEPFAEITSLTLDEVEATK